MKARIIKIQIKKEDINIKAFLNDFDEIYPNWCEKDNVSVTDFLETVLMESHNMEVINTVGFLSEENCYAIWTHPGVFRSKEKADDYITKTLKPYVINFTIM